MTSQTGVWGVVVETRQLPRVIFTIRPLYPRCLWTGKRRAQELFWTERITKARSYRDLNAEPVASRYNDCAVYLTYQHSTQIYETEFDVNSMCRGSVRAGTFCHCTYP
jgi:hypothetical protein